MLKLFLSVLTTFIFLQTNAQNLEDFPDRGLFLGLSNNPYVLQVKKALAFPRSSQDGTFNVELKNAIAIYIKENRVSNIKTDGSVVTKDLYKKILGADTNENVSTAKSYTQQQISPQQTRVLKTDVTFPLYLNAGDENFGYDPRSWGIYIATIQRIVKAEATNIMDKQTLDAVRRYINNSKMKRFITEPLDSETLDVLANNGVNAKLFNTLKGMNDRRIMWNREQTPENVIIID
jgi:hypothetical protein